MMEKVNFLFAVSDATKESSNRVMHDLLSGRYQEHCLTNTAVPFSFKQQTYLSSYERSIRSRNYRFIIECRGDSE